MNLALDIGNSFIKAGFFSEDVLEAFFPRLSEPEVISLIQKDKPKKIIIGAVGGNLGKIVESISGSTEYFIADHSFALPIENRYETPSTLGIDRLAGVVGANFLYPSQNCLVIDAGTCITYDLIDKKGVYLGGSISPGLSIKFKALHTFTARLPFLEAAENVPFTGKNTKQAIQSGVINGTVAEIEGIIAEYSRQFSKIKAIICGGDANFFESKIKAPIFVVPELVLIGLNRILRHNASNK